MEEALAFLNGLSPFLVCVLLSAGAALENVFPVVPADTFVLVGGFVAGLGAVHPVGMFLSVWAFNTAGATAVYAAGRRYGPDFFFKGRGRRLMPTKQMKRLESFYERWGVMAIFVARFLPGFRALVPVFAGVTRQRPLRVVPPILLASAIWYGALVLVGYPAGDNLEAVVAAVKRMNRGLAAASVLLAALVVVLWWKTRHKGSTEEASGSS